VSSQVPKSTDPSGASRNETPEIRHVAWEAAGRVALERDRHPVTVLNPQGRILFCNSAMAALTGWTSSEIAGQQWGSVFGAPNPPDESSSNPAPTSPLFDALPRGSRKAELPCTTRWGESLTLEVELMPLGGDDGAQIMCSVVNVRQKLPDRPRFMGSASWFELDGGQGPDFGRVQRAWYGSTRDKDDPKAQFCSDLHEGSERMCADCPARAARDQGGVHTVIKSSKENPRSFRVITAKKLDDQSIGLSVAPVEESLLSQLLSAKVQALATQGGLSERECAVLDLLLMARSLDDIGAALGISARTVKYHQRNIQRKLGAESRLDLTRLIL